MRTLLNVYRWLRDKDAPDWIVVPCLAAGIATVLFYADVIGEALKHTH